jgi:hypothetical protein
MGSCGAVARGADIPATRKKKARETKGKRNNETGRLLDGNVTSSASSRLQRLEMYGVVPLRQWLSHGPRRQMDTLLIYYFLECSRPGAEFFIPGRLEVGAA